MSMRVITILIFATVLSPALVSAEILPSPTTTNTAKLPTAIADVPMTPQLAAGLSTLEHEYYHSKQVLAILDYTLAVLSRLDHCLTKSPSAHGKMQVEIHLAPLKSGKALNADRFRILENKVNPESRVAVAACLQLALKDSDQRILDESLAKGTVYRTPFTFPVKDDPIYQFLRTGDYHLIVGNVPPPPK